MDASAPPRVLFKTLTNTELGAQAVSVTDDGSVRLEGIVKKVTESMLISYPRTMLGKWTPNRAAVLYTRDEIADRKVTCCETGAELDLDGVLALAG